jgi:hypothetical protein
MVENLFTLIPICFLVGLAVLAIVFTTVYVRSELREFSDIDDDRTKGA